MNFLLAVVTVMLIAHSYPPTNWWQINLPKLGPQSPSVQRSKAEHIDILIELHSIGAHGFNHKNFN